MKRNSTKRVMAIALSAALALTSFTFGGNVTTVKAAGTSIDLVSSSSSNKGDSASYTYNKSGLVTKIVSKTSSKTEASYNNDLDTDNVAKDIATTTTTTYKYNKNNKVSQKTVKTVETDKYYKMDESTGLSVVGNLGTVTTTYTTVTEYTYDKKGNATQSVETSTTGKSGTLPYTNKSNIVTRDDYEQLSDGRILVGYNYNDANGNSVDASAATAYFLSNPSGAGEGTSTISITYTDKGGGVYTKATNNSSAYSGYHTEWTTQRYVKTNGTAVPVNWETRPYTDPDDGYTYDRSGYYSADGTYYDDYDFSITTAVTAVADPTDNSTSTSNSTEDITSKTVTTTKYTYDKKKRVKKASETSVHTNNSVTTRNSVTPFNYDYGDSTEAGTRTNTSKTESTYEATSTSTTDYSYDKKGRAKKAVYSDDGVSNSKYTYSSYTVGSTNESTTTYTDGTAPVSRRTETALSNARTTSTTVVAGGVSTTTTTYNPYTETRTSTSSNGTSSTNTNSYYYNPQDKSWQQGTGVAYSEPGKPEKVTATPYKDTTNYTYDGKNNLKSAKSSGTHVFEYTVKDNTYGNTIYEFNAEGKLEAKKATTTNKFTDKDTYENTVKNKSNSMTEVVGLHDSTYNRSQDSGYSVSHRTFKLKAKKFGKTAKLVKKQQWIIQNGSLNGEVGLL